MELKGDQLGAETIYTKEHKMKSERWAGPILQTVIRNLKFGLSFEVKWKFKTVINRRRNDNYDDQI